MGQKTTLKDNRFLRN